MRVKLFKCYDRDQWNAFVSQTRECPVLQSYEWGEVKSWEAIRLMVMVQDRVAAAASILKRKLPYLNKSVFYCPTGPVLDFNDKKLFRFLIDGVKKEARDHRAVVFKMDPAVAGINFDEFGFRPNKKQIQPRSTCLIDLTAPLEEILKKCEEKTRYNIRLSLRKGVAVREASSGEGLQNFYDLYRKTAERDSFLIHPIKYYQKIKEHLIDRGMAKIFIAYLNDEPVAGVVIFMFGSRVWYMYGASCSEHREVMPNHALHWQVIQTAKSAGYRTYDLWGIPSNPYPGHPLWGVYRFKKGFNGQVVKYVGMQDLVFDPLFYRLFEKGLAFYQGVRSLLTKGKISDSLGE